MDEPEHPRHPRKGETVHVAILDCARHDVLHLYPQGDQFTHLNVFEVTPLDDGRHRIKRCACRPIVQWMYPNELSEPQFEAMLEHMVKLPDRVCLISHRSDIERLEVPSHLPSEALDHAPWHPYEEIHDEADEEG